MWTQKLSKAIATRTKNVLPNIISITIKLVFIEDRYIGETLRTINFRHNGLNSQTIYSRFIDLINFQKAFDGLERNFLQRCLELFNLVQILFVG